MSVTTSGFESVAGIPQGATVTRKYWTIAEHYTIGDAFPTQGAAIRAAIEAREAYLATLQPGHLVPSTIYVDLRWDMQYPDGGGVDLTMQRTTYDTLADAKEHFARIQRYTPTEA